MAEVGLQDLLRAGVHFGHQTSRWNPKMRKYIFAERSGIYLLDLKKTLRQLQRAHEAIQETVEKGNSILFVCTKPQLAEIVRDEAQRCGAFHVTERWVGGLLTNFQTIKKNIRRLKELETGLEEGHFDYYTKKEQILLDRERQKLDRYLSGIKDMTKLPGLVFVVDAKREEIAVKEAHRLEIPVVAIADTNADPDRLDIPIPGNDDAIRAVELVTRSIADAVDAARREMPETEAADEEGVYTYSSDAGQTAEEAAERSRQRRKKRPRRRPKPEVIAAARKSPADEEEEGEEGDADAEAAEEAAPEASAANGAQEASPEAAEDGEPGEDQGDDEGPEAEARAEDETGPASDEDAGEGDDEMDDRPRAESGGASDEDEEAVAVPAAAAEGEEEKPDDTETS